MHLTEFHYYHREYDRNVEYAQESVLITGIHVPKTDIYFLPLWEDARLFEQPAYGYARILEPQYTSRDHIRRWLRTCETEHSKCQDHERRSQSETQHPKRLINVEQMCVQPATESHCRYLALSYVWGNVQRLEPSYACCLGLSCPGILLQDASHIHQVVQDAIQLTRELGETYPWVDVLCICQHDIASRAGEFAMMNDIYKSATMTIIALDSDCADDSLPGVRQPFEPSRKSSITIIDGIRLLQTKKAYEISVFRQPYRWDHRAWCYQEQLLSRRKLYLTKKQAYFSCSEASFCEDEFEVPTHSRALSYGPKPKWLWQTNQKYIAFPVHDLGARRQPAHVRLSRRQAKRQPLPFQQGAPGFGWSQEEDYVEADLLEPVDDPARRSWPRSCGIWPHIDRTPQRWNFWKICTQLYSARLNTFQSDRLHAMQGILNEQKRRWGTDFIAGIPVDYLPLALYWTHGERRLAFHHTQDSNRIDQYPSWSWIGWTGPVAFLSSGFPELEPTLTSIVVRTGRMTVTYKYQVNLWGRLIPVERDTVCRSSVPLIRSDHPQATQLPDRHLVTDGTYID